MKRKGLGGGGEGGGGSEERTNDSFFLPVAGNYGDDRVTNARHFISNGIPPIIVDPRLNCKEHRRKVEYERTFYRRVRVHVNPELGHCSRPPLAGKDRPLRSLAYSVNERIPFRFLSFLPFFSFFFFFFFEREREREFTTRMRGFL